MSRRTGTGSAVTDPDEVLANAKRLQPLLDSHAAANDTSGSIAQDVIDALYDSGAVAAYTPRELGGVEMSPTQILDLFRTLAFADPAAAWVASALGFEAGLAGAFFEKEAANELFQTEHLGIAGQGTRPGKAVPVKGGYSLSGEWSFASGIRHATHVHTAAANTETGETRFFILPLEQVTVIENWDVLGLRATGSLDYKVDGVFVPASFSYPTLSREPVTGGSLYHVGIGNFASINHGGWALGVGRRLLDELSKLVRAKAGRAVANKNNDAFNEEFAEAEAKLRAARALLYEVWHGIEETLGNGYELSTRQETLNRLALSNATWSVKSVADFVFKSAGTAAIRPGVIQRLFRDVNTGTQHISSSPSILQATGRELAGIAIGQQWIHFQLKAPEAA